MPFESDASFSVGRAARAAALSTLVLFLSARLFSANRSLVGMDFGDLMKVKVSSVEMREKDVLRTPASVTVIRSEDIRRSGATTLPELLRGVPGLSVARVNGNTWAISERGGQDPLANKLLVLIDGRSVYTPLFAGVFWDVQDVPLETIDRVEVIRGPGSSVWGANAVNGVINIIRKTPEQLEGTTVSLGGGTEERFSGNVVTGARVGARAAVSAYGRYREYDSLRTTTGQDAGDPGHQGGGGFRVDGKTLQGAGWSLSSDAYDGQFFENRTIIDIATPQTVPVHDETSVNGANVMARWSQPLEQAGVVNLQTYYDHTKRRIPQVFNEVRDTVDVTASHQITLARIHAVTWGAGFRMTTDRVANTVAIRFEPDQATDHITNLFAQDDMQLTRTWTLNLGTKFERNDYTGWEVQPSARTAWEFADHQVLWSAVSHAVRTPTRLDRDVKLQVLASSAPLALLSAEGSENFVSERLTSYEVGYRAQPTSGLAVGLSGFYNVYDHLRGAAYGAPTPETDPAPPHILLPLVINNDVRGETYGAEFGNRMKLASWWQLRGSYSYLHRRLHIVGNNNSVVGEPVEDNDPVQQVYLRSAWNVGPRLELDAGARWVGKANGGATDDYATADVRAAWKARETLTFEVSGQNVLERSHREFVNGEEVERSVFGRVIWKVR